PKHETRMLAAIIPHGEQTWYFKLMGPARQVGEYDQAFRKFVESSRFTGSPGQALTWSSIPEGWQREPGGKLRYATFHLGTKEHPLELTVTALGRESGSVLDNINRWRNQLGLPAITEAEMPKQVQETKAGDVVAKLVDMTGTSSAVSSGMRMPPFAAGRGKVLPAAPAIMAAPFKYRKPEGWTESNAE